MFFGTSASYDYEQGWLREKTEYGHPSSVYGITKLYASQMIGKLAKEYGATYCEARIFSVYGKYERRNRLVPTTIRRLSGNEKVIIEQGDLVRDYLYAEDVAKAVYTCLVNQAEGVYNISSGEPVTIRQIAMRIADMLGKQNLLEIRTTAVTEKENFHLIVGDNSKISALGFKSRYTLQEGISETLEWIRTERLGGLI